MEKKRMRIRRTRRPRAKLRELDVPRLSVHRTPCHIYAQIIVSGGAETQVSASTVESEVKKEVGYGGNIKAATVVGRLIAERALAKGFKAVAFDRAGFKYHGRVKALAESAREHGLQF
ncbi:MAG: 50S ribosomal protein L18 [Gammaproteobacteria bacterium]|nr:50S ribosomal protein L18 [Gammaproteobacteria bacterium]NIM73666.1 50S ribosomal protein L18 [Gammaproteobacteria bacterium]NIN37340.1 50S ribosomal protein L18 [Gammaproteobacteria bacterium]NIO25499.1 50S ribosomal protein L18 [Gammaproteobacteria bacterium]NIO66174.1 50S ribosomal protein L18 [Gammaproteobacteria bacterium]